ncbi:N-alpha-acetyltransferase 16, NatA auxiliary subunit-like [Homalodisca vitripennis]|uniref:N-alpha-acetyltransferase 16, NatA auxiliary subunit-like n=1 Tax=Homalodisca vitripennis TaxID=197043 RepID=UPI001EEB2A19|nr:N-alpha-acetyltransferase 16, NatA auxiliary subunit-like [Homalodisca vitripennis]
MAKNAGTYAISRSLDAATVDEIKNYLDSLNPYVHDFRRLSDEPLERQVRDDIAGDETVQDKLNVTSLLYYRLLLQVDDPLDQAIKFLQPLQLLSSNLLETHLMAYEIYSRKDKPLLMLQSVRRMHRLAPEDPAVHACVIQLSLRYQEWLAQGRLPAPCRQVLAQCMEPITGDRPPLTINQQFLDKYTNYLPAVFPRCSYDVFAGPDESSYSHKTRNRPGSFPERSVHPDMYSRTELTAKRRVWRLWRCCQ